LPVGQVHITRAYTFIRALQTHFSSLLPGGAHDRFLRLLGQRQAIVAGSLSVEPLFPELIQPAAGMDAA
jgi:hypothetical protein